MEPSTNLAIIIGAPSIAAGLIGFFVWSLKRNVRHEDDSKQKSEAKVVELDKAVQDLKTAQALAAQAAQLQSNEVRNQLAQLVGHFGELKGALTSVRQGFEEGREKQAQFYRSEVLKVEERFRTSLERLEAKVDGIKPARKR